MTWNDPYRSRVRLPGRPEDDYSWHTIKQLVLKATYKDLWNLRKARRKKK